MISHYIYTGAILLAAGIVLDIIIVGSAGLALAALALATYIRPGGAGSKGFGGLMQAMAGVSMGLGAVALSAAWLAGVPLEWLLWWWR